MYWRKSIIYVFTVLLPALMVGISNFHVFPDALLLATLMLTVTAGVAGVFSYFSGGATAKIRRYCILVDVVICAILCVNLAGHWILSPEVSAARQGVEEKHTEEDRDDRRKTAEAERQLALRKAEAELADKQAKLQYAESARLARLPRSERRSALTAPTPEPTKPPLIQPLALVAPGATSAAKLEPTARLTPDQAREKWWWFLTALAIAECAASVLAGRDTSRSLGVGPQPRRHTGPPPAAGKIAAATAPILDGTGAAANARPNARQPTTANARQAENSNTRQPAQVVDRADRNSDSSNARQTGFQIHVKRADVHLNWGAANTRQTLDASAAFNYEAQLFRLETYKDRYGRTICKRTVRFVRTRTGRNIGEVTPELAEALSRRPGKGRSAEARAEAERNRLLAESLAKRLRRTKASGRRAATRKGRSGRKARNIADAFGSEFLPGVSDFPRDEGAAYVH